MNALFVGTKNKVELPTKGGYLLIDDTVQKIRGAQIFDPLKHSFNPLRKLDYRRTCDLVDIIEAIFSRGESTLTKDTGLDFIAERLDEHPATLRDLVPPPDRKASTGHIWAYGKVQRLLRSPVLTRVLCGPTEFPFDAVPITIARIDRAELGDFDALVLGLLLISHYQGQVIVPDLGFYGQDAHVSLVRQERLIAGVNFLGELPPKLRRAVLLMKDKTAAGTTFEDAETLAEYKALKRGTVGYDDFVRDAIS